VVSKLSKSLLRQNLRASGDSNEARANRLEQASAHWLRHSAGSHMADQQVDLRLVRDNLGHASLTTTSQYYRKKVVMRSLDTRSLIAKASGRRNST
jgi:integrase/recombinase XerD